MLGAITDYIKSRRHQQGKHILFLGSAVRTSPEEIRVDDLIAGLATQWAADHGHELPAEEPEAAALELMAGEVPDHEERCKLLSKALEDVRISEAHMRLARMISDGYFPAVLTTDSTDLLQRALHNKHMEADKDYHLLVAGVDAPDDMQVALDESKRVVVIKCAGEVTRDFLPLSPAEIREAIDSIGQVIEAASRPLALFVGYAERDLPFIRHVSRDGDRVFWINRIIPMNDEELYQELKLESPASVEYHSLQPEVMEMLSARSSERHLLCREPGEPSAFFSALEQRLIRHERSTRRPRGGSADLTLLSGGPYRFLDFYDVDDAELFFGRERETEDVIEMIADHQLSVLFGAMGRGKTSLLCAGVVATMRQEATKDEGRRWLPVWVRCGDDPVANVKEAVGQAVHDLGFRPPPQDAEFCDFLAEAISTSDRTLVVLLDQFEEYFVKLGRRAQAEAAEQIATALERNKEKLRMLFSIREDYLGQLHELHEYLPEIMHNAYRLRPLDREQAKRAAISPAGPFGIRVEEDLVDEVINDLDREEGIEPAELQIVMDRLYQSLSGRRHLMALHTYQQLEGAERILERYLDYSLSQVPGPDRRLARAILKEMVASSELRTARSVERIAAEVGQSEETVERVLARLIDLRLVRRVGRGSQRTYELVHEYVADKIEHWMSDREIQVKDVQDLLTRELNNYQRFGLLMGKGALRIVANYRNELSIAPEEMEVIIRSAAYREQDADYWLARADELQERLEPTLKAMLEADEAHVRTAALRAVGRRVSLAYLPQLVNLLDDADEEIREAAEEQLRRLDRDLVQALGRGTEQERRLAAYALGRIESRRGLRPLADALDDGDQEMRNEVAEALAEMDAPGTTTLLLNRLSAGEEAPWAVAYALGHIARGPESVEQIEQARRNNPDSPQITFALALAYEHRRDYDAAVALLDEAEQLATTDRGFEAIAEAREEIAAQREQVVAGADDWPLFHGDLQRTGFTPEEVEPPLEAIWRFQTRGPVVASPTVAGGLVCVGSRDGYLYALDSSSGSLRWELKTNDRVEAAPALTGDLMYATSGDGKLHAARLQDGEPMWEYDLGAPSRCSPTVHSGLVYACNQEGRLVALSAADAQPVWEMRAGDEISGAPAISGGNLVVGSWDGSLYAMQPDTGEQLWRADAEGPVAAAVSAAGKHIYCGSDAEAVFAFDAASGDKVWRTRLEGRVRSCPALTEELAIVGCMDGSVYALNRADGSIVWSAETEDEVLSSAAIAGSTVYIGSKDGNLYALSLGDGSVLWRYETSYAVYSSPAITGQRVVLGLEYYNVMAFTPKTPTAGVAR